DLLPRCHVDDERIIRRPSLRLEDEADRVGIESIRTQPVYRFRRKGYRLTTPQIGCRLFRRICQNRRHRWDYHPMRFGAVSEDEVTDQVDVDPFDHPRGE